MPRWADSVVTAYRLWAANVYGGHSGRHGRLPVVPCPRASWAGAYPSIGSRLTAAAAHSNLHACSCTSAAVSCVSGAGEQQLPWLTPSLPTLPRPHAGHARAPNGHQRASPAAPGGWQACSAALAGSGRPAPAPALMGSPGARPHAAASSTAAGSHAGRYTSQPQA
jgi:hypothetical protein